MHMLSKAGACIDMIQRALKELFGIVLPIFIGFFLLKPSKFLISFISLCWILVFWNHFNFLLARLRKGRRKQPLQSFKAITVKLLFLFKILVMPHCYFDNFCLFCFGVDVGKEVKCSNFSSLEVSKLDYMLTKADTCVDMIPWILNKLMLM
jgi:hypothetical protein